MSILALARSAARGPPSWLQRRKRTRQQCISYFNSFQRKIVSIRKNKKARQSFALFAEVRARRSSGDRATREVQAID